jgi:hypothetical protein
VIDERFDLWDMKLNWLPIALGTAMGTLLAASMWLEHRRRLRGSWRAGAMIFGVVVGVIFVTFGILILLSTGILAAAAVAIAAGITVIAFWLLQLRGSKARRGL